jgi:hypothetical protein
VQSPYGSIQHDNKDDRRLRDEIDNKVRLDD